ncbi:MAG: RagB/SusD family nutrient uptake outer membrane protein, partial [Hoylesella buccalis]
MKKQLVYTALLGLAVIPVSCNDFLDSEPITEVSTNVYLESENDLAAYAAKFYDDRDDGDHPGNILPSHGSGAYHLGLFGLDNGTDNQTTNVPSKLFVKGQFHVNEGNSNLWKTYMKKIRAANYFLSKVASRVEQGKIAGNASRARHYLGEVYFFRAYIY